ncbi:MAG: glycosyltransferase [Acidimicrobiales bacterium]
MTGAPPPATYAVIAGGGTAGHVLPGLAIAQALVDAGHDQASIRFVGSARGLEVDLVPEAGYALEALPGRGIQRKLSLANVAAAFGIVRHVAGDRPPAPLAAKVLLVLGGYAAAPCVVAGALWRADGRGGAERPGGLGEPAGRSLRSRLCGALPETDLPRTEVTGNPVRAELLALDPGERPSASTCRAGPARRPGGGRRLLRLARRPIDQPCRARPGRSVGGARGCRHPPRHRLT